MLVFADLGGVPTIVSPRILPAPLFVSARADRPFAAGNGTIAGQRLYRLGRENGSVTDDTFRIQFLDAGAQAYAFTFG